MDDLEPVTGFLIAGIEADCLAKEGGGGVVLVAACRELAEQAERGAAGGVEADDVAQVALGIEVTAQRDMSACADQEKGHALGLVFEGVRDHRDDPWIMARGEQLLRCRNDSSIHDCQNQQGTGHVAKDSSG